MYPFVGFAKDIHNLINNPSRPLKLGGITIPSDYAIVAHSDGDIVFHAIASALLGAMGLSITIGELFDDQDISHKDMDSSRIIHHILQIMEEKHYQIHNLDITLVCEHIKLAPYLKTIQNHLIEILQTPRIGIKCTRFEDLQNYQIECDVICSLINHN